jgi:hypothetical protein
VEHTYALIARDWYDECMRTPDLLDSFVHEGEEVKVEWFDVRHVQDLPEIPWKQVYIVGDLDGKTPIIFYENHEDVGLPGGKTEPGETVDETIRREVIEETNCEVISWVPLGYQRLSQSGKPVINQLRLYGELKKRGEFEFDPGGGVVGYRLIELDSLNDTLQWGMTGQRIQEMAIQIKRKGL